MTAFHYSLCVEIQRPREFTLSFTETLVEVLRACYGHVGPGGVFRPRFGLDERWAALTIAMLAGPAYTRRLRGFANVTVRRAGLVHEVAVGPHILRTNKLGRTLDENVVSSFPGPSRAVVHMASANQVSLDLPDIDQEIEKRLLVDLPPPTRWIIGHMGTSSAGLQAVYLCAPWKTLDMAVTEWRGWVTVYRKDGLAGSFAPPPGLPTDPLPPAIDVELPPMDLLDDEKDVQEKDAS